MLKIPITSAARMYALDGRELPLIRAMAAVEFTHTRNCLSLHGPGIQQFALIVMLSIYTIYI